MTVSNREMTVSNRLTGRFLILNGHGQKTMNRDEIKRDENGQNMNRDEIKRDENGQNMFDRRCLLDWPKQKAVVIMLTPIHFNT